MKWLHMNNEKQRHRNASVCNNERWPPFNIVCVCTFLVDVGLTFSFFNFMIKLHLRDSNQTKIRQDKHQLTSVCIDIFFKHNKLKKKLKKQQTRIIFFYL